MYATYLLIPLTQPWLLLTYTTDFLLTSLLDVLTPAPTDSAQTTAVEYRLLTSAEVEYRLTTFELCGGCITTSTRAGICSSCSCYHSHK